MAKTRILIVEDERIIASDIKETLAGFGYSVIGIVDSGEQAIIKAEELRPDIILMDIMLKGKMSGIDAASKIKERMDIPIIYLTSYADNNSIEKAKVTEPFGYVLKPFSEKELHTTIEMAIYKHNSEKKIKESERKYKALYDNAPDGFVSSNQDWIIFESNKKFRDMLGYSLDEINNSSFLDYMTAESNENFKKVVQKFEQKGFILNFDAIMIKKNKELLPVIINSSVLLDEDKNFVKTQTTIKDVSTLKNLEAENVLLSEKIIKLSKKIPLTDNEKRVFAGIVCNPILNDVDLSRKLKIKRSTVTSIRNKLTRENYFTIKRIPNLSGLGLELLTVFHADFNQANPNREKMDELTKKLSKCDEVFYMNVTDKVLMGFAATKNLTTLKKGVISVFDEFDKYELLTGKMFLHFHFELCTIEKFFDFANLITNMFELDLQKTTANKVPKQRRLTEKEKSIFYNLVNYPSMNDSEIAEESKIPRPSISQTRKRLTTEGYIMPLNIPNPLQIKYELFSINYMVLERGASTDLTKKLMTYMKNLPSTIVLLNQESEIYILSLFNDYSESDITHSNIIRFIADNKIPIQKEVSKLLPITRQKLSKMDFAPLLKNNLGLSSK